MSKTAVQTSCQIQLDCQRQTCYWDCESAQDCTCARYGAWLCAHRILLFFMQGERWAQGHVGLRVKRTDGDGWVRTTWSTDGWLNTHTHTHIQSITYIWESSGSTLRWKKIVLQMCFELAIREHRLVSVWVDDNAASNWAWEEIFQMFHCFTGNAFWCLIMQIWIILSLMSLLINISCSWWRFSNIQRCFLSKSWSALELITSWLHHFNQAKQISS